MKVLTKLPKTNKTIYFSLSLFILSLFLISPNLTSAATYYVSTSGSDTNDGLTESTPWQTLAKVNSSTFLPGDDILFKREDIFSGSLIVPSSGTAGNYINFSSYGSGEKPIIDPSEDVTATWILAPEVGVGVYKTTDILYNPKMMIIDNKKIPRINDRWMTERTTYNETFFNENGFDWLNKSSDAKVITYYTNIEINFWDGLDALYGHLNGTTYIRFRNGDDPNLKNIRSSAGGGGVYIYDHSYVVIDGFFIRASEYNIYLFRSAHHNIIENNKLFHGRKRVFLYTGPSYNKIRNNEMSAELLTDYEPGSWSGGTQYSEAVKEYIYLTHKFLIGTASSDDSSIDVYYSGEGNEFYNNYVHDGLIGIDGAALIDSPIKDLKIYNNIFAHHSSVGVVVSNSWENAQIYDNLIYDNNINIRWHNLAVPGQSKFSVYMYKNYLYNPSGVGDHIYCYHLDDQPWPANTTKPTLHFYHNSVSGGDNFFGPGWADHKESLVNTLMLNNIYSGDRAFNATIEFIQNEIMLDKFDYNWISGWQSYHGVPFWFGSNNNNHLTATAAEEVLKFWDDSSMPNFVLPSGSEPVDSGIDLSKSFTIDGDTYSALPGMEPGYFVGSAPDRGAYELGSGADSVTTSNFLIRNDGVGDGIPTPDTTIPTISSFTIPTTSTTLSVPITTFTATDNIGVTGYLLRESSTTPSAGSGPWTTTKPTSYLFTTEGTKTLYAWARDASGNVSLSSTDQVIITLPVVTPGGGGGGGGGGGSTTPTCLSTETLINNICQPNTTLSLTDKAKLKDVKRDGIINILDFNILMVNWNKNYTTETKEFSLSKGDLNQDGMIGILDVNQLMVYWGVKY